jgi:hypothetical protein
MSDLVYMRTHTFTVKHMDIIFFFFSDWSMIPVRIWWSSRTVQPIQNAYEKHLGNFWGWGRTYRFPGILKPKMFWNFPLVILLRNQAWKPLIWTYLFTVQMLKLKLGEMLAHLLLPHYSWCRTVSSETVLMDSSRYTPQWDKHMIKYTQGMEPNQTTDIT